MPQTLNGGNFRGGSEYQSTTVQCQEAMMMFSVFLRRQALLLRQVLTLLVLTCLAMPDTMAAQSPVPVRGHAVVTEVVAGLAHPWALAFMPDGSMLITERPGRLRILSADGTLSEPVEGVP